MNMKKKLIIGIILFIPAFIIVRYFQYIYYLSLNVMGDFNELVYNDRQSSQKVLERYEKAEKIYKEPYIFYNKQIAYMDDGNYLKSIEEGQKALKYINNYPIYDKTMQLITLGVYKPDSKEFYKSLVSFQLFIAARNTGNYELCATAADNVAPPFVGVTYYDRAICKYHLKQYDKALDDFKMAKKEAIKMLEKNIKKENPNREAIEFQRKRIKETEYWIKKLENN